MSSLPPIPNEKYPAPSRKQGGVSPAGWVGISFASCLGLLVGVFALIIVAVLVVGAINIGVNRPTEADAESGPPLAAELAEPAEPAEPIAPAQPAEPAKTASQVVDDQFIADGFQVAESGSLYFRWANDGEVTCGQWRCAGVIVQTINGCQNSLYVEASLLSGGAVVGMANDSLGVVSTHGSAVAILEDYQDIGDSFRVTKVNCH